MLAVFVCACVCDGERKEQKKRETFVSPGVLCDASGGILLVTAQVIEAKSASLYLLCRTVIHRAAGATASLLLERNQTVAPLGCGVFTQLEGNWASSISSY